MSNEQGTEVQETSRLVQCSLDLREKLLRDPHRPGYHFTSPGGCGMPFDPNGAIFWRGRYHLFYIFQDERLPGSDRHHWGHASSIDLLHWHHHPTKLLRGMFSGNCFVNKQGRPTICHHKCDLGNSMVVSLDDELDEWEMLKSNPITPATREGDAHHGKYRSWDPFGWLEGDTYYAIFGGKRPAIAKSKALEGPWEYVGDLMAHGVEGVEIDEDVSCADLFPFGGKHMLLCISHRLGCRYYIGEWKHEQFHPEFHAQMSWADNGFFAPRSMLDGKGRRIMWAWIIDGRSKEARAASGWSGTMCLPRVLSPAKDNSLLISVPDELEALRYNPRKLSGFAVEADTPLPLDDVRGNSIELEIEVAPGTAKRVGVKVCCSPRGEEETLVYYDAAEQKLVIDAARSGTETASSPAFIDRKPQPVESGPFALRDGETLKLRIFVDKSVVEVFANHRQAVMRQIYPTRGDSLGVALFSTGSRAKVKKLSAWDMAATNPW